MHGKNFGWVNHIEKVLNHYLTPKMNMNGVYQAISHHMLIHKLHTIVHHAAAHNHGMIKKMYHVMHKTGWA